MRIIETYPFFISKAARTSWAKRNDHLSLRDAHGGEAISTDGVEIATSAEVPMA